MASASSSADAGAGPYFPPPVYAPAECAADVLAWRDARGPFLTVLAALSFGWSNGGVCALGPAPTLHANERHRDKSPLKSLEAPSDIVPYLPHPEVLLVGSAYAPAGRGVATLAVQVSLARKEVSFRKRIQVVGERAGAAAQPFRQMPLVWERAVRHAHNPVGAEAALASLLDPNDAARPACFAPLSALWPARRSLLKEGQRPRWDVEPMDVRADSDPLFFQSAPRDQWLAELHGDEWLALDGLHPALQRVQMRLPGARLETRLFEPAGKMVLATTLSPVRLLIDSERQTGTLLYTAVASFPHVDYRRHRLALGLAVGGPVRWPNVDDPAALRPHFHVASPRIELDATLDSTADGPRVPAPAAAMPFAPAGRGALQDPPSNAPAPPSAPRAQPPPPPARSGPKKQALRGTKDLSPVAPKAALPFVSSSTPAAPPKIVDEPTEDGAAGAPDVAPLPFEAAAAAARAATVTSDRGAFVSHEAIAPASGAGFTIDDEDTGLVEALRKPALPFVSGAAPPPAAPALAPHAPAASSWVAPPAVQGDDEATGLTALPNLGPPIPFASAPASPPQWPPGAAAPPIAPVVDEGAPFRLAPPAAFTAPASVAPPPPMASAGVAQPPMMPRPSVIPTSAAPPASVLPPAAAAPRASAEPKGPVEPPKRLADMVPWLCDQPLVVATIGWQVRPPQDSLIVVVKGEFRARAERARRHAPEPALPVGDVFVDDDFDRGLIHASDFAISKPRVDVLLSGHAYAPNGRATHVIASLRVTGKKQRVERAVAVVGDRVWQRVGHSPPEPFEKMPLVYERAFGGPGYGDNPVGAGFKGHKGADGVARLPNLEHPSKLIGSPSDTPPPACFGPIHPLWKPRWSLIGSYTPAWFRARWPYYPEDFDYGYFQAAPPEQQLDAADGSEDYELIGLHPEHKALRGKLPGIQARCFAQHTREAGGRFVEIGLKLDTVSFDTDGALVHLVWRGRLDVSDDDAPEIAELFATAEPLAGERMDLEAARARYQAARAAKVAPDEKIPSALPLRIFDEAPPPDADDAMLRDLEADIEAQQEAAREKLRAQGHDPGVAGSAPEPPPVDVEVVAARMREAGADEASVQELVAVMSAPDEVPPPAAPSVDLRALVMARMAAGESLGELDLRGADLTDLDLSRQVFTGSDLSDAKLDGAKLAGAVLTEVRLCRASLQAAACDAAAFAGADFSDAVLERARFCEAVLDDALLLRVRAPHADFSRCSALRAQCMEGDFSHAVFEGAAFTSADFTQCKLERANFTRAKLGEVRLYDVAGERATFAGADLTGARAEAAAFRGAFFTEVRADGSVWERAVLARSSFQGASLKDASFVRADCEQAIFAAADLTEGRLRRAKLRGARFQGANLMGASLERANLEDADLRGANLHAATIVRTALRGAKLDGAIVSYSALGRKQP